MSPKRATALLQRFSGTQSTQRPGPGPGLQGARGLLPAEAERALDECLMAVFAFSGALGYCRALDEVLGIGHRRRHRGRLGVEGREGNSFNKKAEGGAGEKHVGGSRAYAHESIRRETSVVSRIRARIRTRR